MAERNLSNSVLISRDTLQALYDAVLAADEEGLAGHAEPMQAARSVLDTVTVWQPFAAAPRDRPILVNAGFSPARVAIWNECVGGWVCAELQHSLSGGASDPTWIDMIDVTHFGWMELPEVCHG